MAPACDDEMMPSKRPPERSFQARVEGAAKGRAYVVLAFDPEKAWGPRARYHVRGTINGNAVRGALEQFGKGYFLPLGPAYRRDTGLNLGDLVTVMLMPEGCSEALMDMVTALRPSRSREVFDGCVSIGKTTAMD